MERNTVLSLRDISYSYNGKDYALTDLSIDIFKNEKIAVLGSNGAGKSTLFLCMNGVIKPDMGKIFLNEVLINKKNLNELRKNVSIIFQEPENQIIAPTVFSEISFGPVNLGLSIKEVKKRTNYAMSYMGLEKLSDRPVHYLSGGEKKRVTIADVIAMDSEIMIFDEPECSLDPRNCQMFEDVLKRLSECGKSIIISTHDVNFAHRFADRIVTLHNGRIISDSGSYETFNNKEVLEKAGLKRPYIFDITDLLIRKGLMKDILIYPKTIEELDKLL